jgi:pSer/pThr/pTyr-binding forkhead associated (FHA) protein
VSETDERCPSCAAETSAITESFAPVAGEDVELAEEVGAVHGPVLVVRKGPEVGERFELSPGTLTVGRDPEADIFLNDVTVSREHAVLEISEGAVALKDVGSLNGTFVNAERVCDADLRPGDQVQVGRFQMVFLDEGRG